MPRLSLLVARLRRADALDRLGRELVDEAGRQICCRAAVEHTLARVGDDQMLLGPGDGDVAQPPLLFQLLRLAHAAVRGEQSLLQTDKEHVRELQTLGRVHRHHDDGIGIRVVLLNVCVQGNLLQEACQRGRLGVFHVAEDAGFELADVLRAGAGFHVALLLEHLQIAGARHDLLIEIRQRQLLQQLRAFLDDDREGHELRSRLFQARVAVGVGDDRVQRDAGRGRLPPGHFERLAADAARRVIDDALQPQLVGAVIDDAKVGQHVLDLRAVKEARAADDAVRDAAALERVFDRVGLRVRAVEHGEVLEILPL